MAESVDALVSNTSGAIHPGSIPGLGTELETPVFGVSNFFFILTWSMLYYCLRENIFKVWV